MKSISQKNGITYLHNIDLQTHEMFDQMILRLAETNGITEKLKVSAPMRWVQEMNAIRSVAEELIFCDLIGI